MVTFSTVPEGSLRRKIASSLCVNDSPSLPVAAARKCKLRFYAVRSRGHSSTSSDAIIQHATIKINPPRNEPVRWLRSPMILGPKNPPMLAVQLMKPTAAAAAELVRNEDGSAQNDGR